ncbi:MAG: efflux RND transporter periplasmic adaptor subunit [Rhodospirillaceae bacterium]
MNLSLLVWAAMAAALTAPAAPLHAQQAMTVGVDPVIRESTRQTLPVLGRFVARKAGAVAARINGPIDSFYVEVGDRVARGEIIAVLVKDRLQTERDLRAAEVARYEAARQTAGETMKLRQQELNRLEGLRKSAAFSQARLEDKRQEVAVARAQIAEADGQLKSARANLHLAEINLFNADITAPYDGVVTRRHTEAGAFVDVGAPVVTMIDDSSLEIEAEVPARNTAALFPGLQVRATLENGRGFAADVRAVIPEDNPQTRTRTVRFTPQGGGNAGDTRAAVNQSVTVAVPISDADTVLTVHKDAILNRDGKTAVFLNQNGKAVVRPVQLASAVGSRLIVLSGLAEGDIVVVRGNERLRPDQPINFTPSAPAKPPVQPQPSGKQTGEAPQG